MLKKIMVYLVIIAAFCSPIAGFAETYPAFSLAWSEYPSWSVFGVAHKYGLIDGRKGKLGPIEKKWKVDIVLKEAEYDPCITIYASCQVDAVCITNIDVLNPSLRVKSVAIMPTSTSYGGDGVAVDKKNVPDLAALKGKNTYGQEKSVSEYTFVRNLELLGENKADYPFVHKDASVAAMAMQQRQSDFDSIVVWNPFLLSTLDKRSDVYVLFDSRKIPGEILDLVVVAEKSLQREGGDRFALAVMDTFYAVSKRMKDPKTANETLVAIGEKFSNLNLQSMKTVVKQTRFYETPQMALSLFTGGEAFPGGKVETDGNLMKIMERVEKTCLALDFIPQAPKVGYGDDKDADFRFDPTYLNKYVSGK